MSPKAHDSIGVDPRIKALIVDYVDSLQTPPPPTAMPVAPAPEQPRPPAGARRAARVAAVVVAVAAMVAALFTFPSWRGTQPAGGPGLTTVQELPGIQGPFSPDIVSDPLPQGILMTTPLFINPDNAWFPSPWNSSMLALSPDRNEFRTVSPADVPGRSKSPTVVSPDGSRLAVGSQARSGNLTVIDATTGALRELGFGPQGSDAVPLAWSHDGRRFYAYATVPIPDLGAPPDPSGVTPQAVGATAEGEPGDLYSVDAATGARTLLPGAAGSTSVTPSADGRQLLIAGDKGARIVDAVTGQVRRTITTDTSISFGPEAWSPTGRWAVGYRKQDAGSHLVRIDTVSGAIRPILNDPTARGVVWTGDDTFVILRGNPERGDAATLLSALDVKTGAVTDLAQWSRDRFGTLVSDVSIARDLAPKHLGSH